MFNSKTKLIAGLLVASIGLSGCASTLDSDVVAVSPTPVASAPSVEIIVAGMTDEQIAWEALMSADGEYAAAASYQAVIDEFGPVEPYTTILAAELRHIDALIRQLENMGATVPDNPYIGEIAAPADLAAAAAAWAEGEILNVEMYDRLIAEADGSSLVRVLTNLRRSSLESHLPSFELAAENGGTLTLDQMKSH